MRQEQPSSMHSANMRSSSIGDLSQLRWLVFAMAVLVVLPAPRGSLVLGNPDAKRLYDDLLSNYNKLVRPVVNTTDVLKVCIKLKLSQLIDVVSGFMFNF